MWLLAIVYVIIIDLTYNLCALNFYTLLKLDFFFAALSINAERLLE